MKLITLAVFYVKKKKIYLNKKDVTFDHNICCFVVVTTSVF